MTDILIQDLIPVTGIPRPGDIVYHENQGLVKYRVADSYSGRHREIYSELVTLEVIQDYGNGFFQPGHNSIRPLSELLQERQK